MKKEDLIKLKEKISKLSEEEQKLRNIYLRKIANSELYGPIVGKSSIDKPWLKYFLEEDIFKECPSMSMYEYLYKKNKENLNLIALNYFGNKIHSTSDWC